MLTTDLFHNHARHRNLDLGKATCTLASLLAVLAVAGCTGSGEDVGTTTEAIRKGSVVNGWTTGPIEARAIVRVGGCTGTVVKPSWVLVAAHCGTGVGTTVVSTRAPGTVVNHTVDVAVPYPDNRDLLMLHLDQPFTDMPTLSFYAGTNMSIVGKALSCYGYGAKEKGGSCVTTSQCAAGFSCDARCSISGGGCLANGTCPAGAGTCSGSCLLPSQELRVGTLTAAVDNRYRTETYLVPITPAGQEILPGDSGGPCMLPGGVITGVHSVSGVDMGIVSGRDWLTTPSRSAFVSADFNGDGRMDYVVTTVTGSEWFYSTGVGTWNNAYSRSDLPIGKVHYTPGDFDGDGKADLAITVAGGTFFYYSTGTGTWDVPSAAIKSTADFRLGRQAWTTGDFNGDGKTDFLISTSEHTLGGKTQWFYSTGRGTWNDTLVRTDLKWGNVSYTPGDFDGDKKTDLVIMVNGGTFFYYSTGTGTWDVPSAAIRSDLILGSTQYTAGDFNGDKKTDLAITVAGGTFFYYSTGRGTWNVPAGAVRDDLKLGTFDMKTADFNGDGKTDTLVTTAAGSDWSFSTGTGTWNVAFQRSDLTRGTVQYTVGDFNGGGKADLAITVVGATFFYYSTGTGTWNIPSAAIRDDLKL